MNSEDLSMNQKLFREATQEIAFFMFNVGITKSKELSFFKEDGGIFERLFLEHITSPDVDGLKEISEDVYLRVLGMHAFGAGAYSAAKETEYGRCAAEFTKDEQDGIFLDFELKDAYELALEKLGIPIESGNRKMLDRVIVIGIKEEKLISGDEIFDHENLKTFMKVLFNAGISVYKAIINE